MQDGRISQEEWQEEWQDGDFSQGWQAEDWEHQEETSISHDSIGQWHCAGLWVTLESSLKNQIENKRRSNSRNPKTHINHKSRREQKGSGGWSREGIGQARRRKKGVQHRQEQPIKGKKGGTTKGEEPQEHIPQNHKKTRREQKGSGGLSRDRGELDRQEEQQNEGVQDRQEQRAK